MENLDPIAKKFIDRLTMMGGKSTNELPIKDARNVLESLQSGPIEKLPAKIVDLSLEHNNTSINIRIITPLNHNHNNSLLPIVMYFHGGGWVLGSTNTHDRLVREIANSANVAVVFVDYDRSPEAHYPIAIEQAYTATVYFSEHGLEYGLDGSRLAVVGDSVGGNMAAVVAMLAKERSKPKILHQVLLYPVTNSDFYNASYQQFTKGPWLTKDAMEWYWNNYQPILSKRINPLLSPLQATIEELKGLPPTLIITDENDVLRDEAVGRYFSNVGEAYAHKLMQAGVKVAAVRIIGLIHDFMMLNDLAEAPGTRAAIDLTNMTLYKALNIR